MRSLSVALVLAFAAALSAGAQLLARDGAPAASVVVSEQATPAEQTAAEELSHYLGAVTGGTFSTATAAEGAGAAIYVGDTAFARANGIDAAALGEEEWVLKTIGPNLVLAGGRPRGTLYAVCRFLEDEVGVHWWNAWEESVPARPTLDIAPLDRRGAPVFRYRDIYMLYGRDGGRFAARNRLNRDGDAGIDVKYGGEMDYGAPYHVHTFNMYIPPEKYFAEHPEWFSLIDGKRSDGQAQICLTNPELRQVFRDKLFDYIRADRARAAETGAPPPLVYSVSQNDWRGMCQCDACQAIAKAEESEVGPLLDFVNYMADAVKTEYPDVFIDTLAYMMTQQPPKTIRPRDNVVVRLCDTESNFTRAITSPENQAFHDHLLAWSGIAKNLRIWDYAVTYAGPRMMPMASVHTYADDYRFYAGHNVEGVFTELEYPVLADMRDFKVWMMMKLLEDPYQDYDALVNTFTDGFYGPAGGAMRDYLAVLQNASERKISHISMGAMPSSYRYLDLDYFQKANACFDAAEAAVDGEPALLRRVRCARLATDRAALVLYAELAKEWQRGGGARDTMPLDRDAIAQRVKETWYAEADARLGEAEAVELRKQCDDELAAVLALPVWVAPPGRFAGLPPERVFQFTANESRNWQDAVQRVPDRDAETGVTNRRAIPKDEEEKYALPMPWGVYDAVAQKGVGNGAVRREDITGPGYHWYKMGEFPVTPGSYVYFFWSWVIQQDVGRACDPSAPDRRFEVWARIKFEGPMFPYGDAGDENAISVEQVVLVAP